MADETTPGGILFAWSVLAVLAPVAALFAGGGAIVGSRACAALLGVCAFAGIGAGAIVAAEPRTRWLGVALVALQAYSVFLVFMVVRAMMA